jgi:hypothetical protein
MPNILRLWLLAQIQPEWQEKRAKLATALDMVGRTDSRFFEGDALDPLPGLIANSTGPLCVYHANCVVYWSDEAKARLEAQLLEASRGREFDACSGARDCENLFSQNHITSASIRRLGQSRL